MNVGDELYGYKLSRVENLEKLGNTYYEFEHVKTGARHIHLSNEDKNNCFGVAFRTTPKDSTGVAHILEHTALCGSEKFQVRDPFFGMIKRSLNTFMNAFTASDWTMYPYCSQNKTDFYNLMDVYLDASFFPTLEEINFRQEGHRLEFAEPENSESPLIISGVVYNEMKGAMSQPASVMHRRLLKSVYPTITYHHNSGGEPSAIPDLTYQQFVDFHKNHYHPSNSYFYTYGNLPVEEHLKFISERVLDRFGKIDPGTEVGDEKRFTEPQSFQYHYPLNKDDDDGAKNFCCLSWLACECFNPVENFTMELIETILLGHAGAPLSKALLESGLGKNYCPGTGYMNDNRETVFSAGLEGVKSENIDKVEELVIATLKKVVEEGIPSEAIDTAIHQMELATREVTGARTPHSLNLFFRFVGSWLHGGDPVESLDFDKTLDIIREKLKGEKYLEAAIKRHLIDNPHRVKIVLSPDYDMEEREKAALAKELEDVKSKLSAEEVQAIIDGAKELKAHQEKEEDLSCLPMIHKEDLDRKTPKIEHDPVYEKLSDIDVAFYEQPTNGVNYINLLFDIKGLSEDELKLLPLFGSLVSQSGAGELNYADMGERVSRYTGGISVSPICLSNAQSNKVSHDFLQVSGKALTPNIETMLDIIHEFISSWNFADYSRTETIIKKRLNNLENDILGSGHGYAMKLASRNSSTGLSKREILAGVHQVKTMQEIAKLPEDELKVLVERLNGLGKKLLSKDKLRACFTGTVDALKAARPLLTSFFGKLETVSREEVQGVEGKSEVIKEAWTTTTPVSYVAKSFETATYKDDDSAKLRVLSRVLGPNYLHNEIREKGGAYGGMASYNALDGVFNFGSYRDPHLKRTREVYEGIFDYLASGKIGQKEVEELVVEIFGSLDAPSSPSGNAISDYYDAIAGLTYDMKQKSRDNIFNTNFDDVVEVANKYLKSEASEAVITSEEIIKRDEVTDLKIATI